DAIPALVAALDRLPPSDRARALEELRYRRAFIALDPAPESPLAWNLARQRAREALAQLPSE
ncbi:MAG TPA: hypothetical protein VM451_02360, partial [Candidatus Limnocylindria bacterium]|nr:hypothetical protein [Candidatus Limnocylindria bacterium]